MSYKVQVARSDADVDACHAVMSQLRPHVPRDGFVQRVRRMETQGYRLAFIAVEGTVRAVAGYRVLEQLVRGRVLYVDDLVTDSGTRSRGLGRALLDWLADEARREQCTHLELDSGVQRADAHRFYFRERMSVSSWHFVKSLAAAQGG